MTKEKKAFIYASISIIFWSTVATAFKLVLNHTNYLMLLLYASLTSLLTFGGFIVFQNKFTYLKNLTFKDIIHSVFFGFMNPFLYYLVLFKAYELLPAQQAQPLNYTWPVILPLLSMIFLKQKLHTSGIISLLISFSGVYILINQGIKFQSYNNFHGVLLALGSAFIWSLFWLFAKKDDIDIFLRLFLNFFFGSIFIFLLILLSDSFIWLEGKIFLGTIYIGIFEMGITFIFWTKALKMTRNTAKLTNYFYLTPFISLLFIALILKENIGIYSLAGLLLIIGGIFLQKYSGNNKSLNHHEVKS